MNNQEELKGLISEVLASDIKKAKDEMIERQDKYFDDLSKANQETQREVKEAIDRIENSPLIKGKITSPESGKSTEVYFGRKMSYQGLDVENGQRLEKAQSQIGNVKRFAVFADEEKREEYAKFFIRFIQGKVFGDPSAVMAHKEWIQKADLAEGADNTGGYLVPEEYASELIAFARLNSFALNECRIWPMGSQTLNIPVENSSVSVAWKAEAVASGASNPTFTEAVLTAKKLTAYSTSSNELLADSRFDIVSYLTEIFSEAIGQELDNQVLNGTGTPVSGLFLTAGKSVVMSNTAFSAITADDLSNMIDAVDQQVEDGCKFYFHKNILTYINQLKDTTNACIFRPISGGQPNDIWSYGYTRTPKAPAKGVSSADTPFVIFGNMRYFALGRRYQSMSLDVDPYGKFLESQTRFKIENRWGMAVTQANAFVKLVTAA